MKSLLILALALVALAAIGMLWLRRGEVAAPPSATFSAPAAPEPNAPQLAPVPSSESVASARESADEVAPKSDLPLMRDLAAGPAEEPDFAKKYGGMDATGRRSAKDALERILRSANPSAEDAAALSREIAWLEAHPGS